MNKTKTDLLILLEKVQNNHSKKANDLLELFLNKIKSSFVSEEYDLNNN